MSQDEQTRQSLASTEELEEALGTEQQTQDDSDLDQSASTEEQYLIPEKFVGKSSLEISQAYRELEKERGRLANELGSARKEREEYEERYRNLERAATQYQAVPASVPSQQVHPSDQDPLEVLRSNFDDDPKAAMIEYARLQREQQDRSTRMAAMQQQAREADQYYWSQEKENPDYKRLVPDMQRLLSEYQDVVKPEFVNSPKVLKALYAMARGNNVDHYTKEAADRAQKDRLSVLEEKRNSQSGSGYSDSDNTVDARKIPLDDLEAMLGTTDDD